MFTFTGRLGRRSYALAAGLRLALFGLSVLAFPLLLQGLASLSNCRAVGGACGAVGLVGAMAFKPAVAALLVFSFAGISVRRARDAGLTGLPGLIVPILVGLNYDMLTVFGAPWSLAFTMGVLALPGPRLLVAALASMVLLCLLPSRGGPAVADPTDIRPPGRLAVLAALALTLLAFAMGVGPSLGEGAPVLLPLSLLTHATSVVAPTFAIYLGLAWAATAFARRPSLRSVLVVAAAAIPFCLWGHARWTSAQDRTAEAEAIAAVPTARPATVPGVMLVEAGDSAGLRAAWTVPGIERVVARGPSAAPPSVYTRESRTRPVAGPAPELPERYLVLKIGRQSGFARPGSVYEAAGGPFELRLVEAGRDELVSVWYRRFAPPPTSPPLLALSGWFRGPNVARSDDVAAGLARFLAEALGPTRAATALRGTIDG